MSNHGDDDEVAATVKADDVLVDRSCIGCDNCGVASPQKCCARCSLFYYCSKECQVQHWKQHKSACTVIKTKHDKWKKAMNNVLPDGTVNDTKEGPCAICLEETITNPVVMPCGHVFCFACVGQYQQSSTSKEGVSCPYCRGEIPDVAERAAERAMLYGDRAIASPKGSEEQKKYAKFSLAEFESIIKLFDPDKNIVAYMMMLHTNAMMLSMADQPEQTINVTKELLVLNEKYYGNLTFDVKDKVSEAKYWQAQAYSDCGKWKDAVKSYKSLIRFQKQLGGNPGEATLMGYSRAMYELRKYDEAIEMGSTAIEKARHQPGVHKYVVLSQKAMGDIEDAKRTMSRAILYEFHWDKDNMQKNKELLWELNNL